MDLMHYFVSIQKGHFISNGLKNIIFWLNYGHCINEFEECSFF